MTDKRHYWNGTWQSIECCLSLSLSLWHAHDHTHTLFIDSLTGWFAQMAYALNYAALTRRLFVIDWQVRLTYTHIHHSLPCTLTHLYMHAAIWLLGSLLLSTPSSVHSRWCLSATVFLFHVFHCHRCTDTWLGCTHTKQYRIACWHSFRHWFFCCKYGSNFLLWLT